MIDNHHTFSLISRNKVLLELHGHVVCQMRGANISSTKIQPKLAKEKNESADFNCR